MAGLASSGPLVGRVEHLDAVRRQLGQARAGEPRLVLVVGDPGVGKSRLVGEVSGEVDDRARVLVTHCLELSGAVVPLAPVQDLVHRAYRRLGVEEVARAAGPYLSALSVLEPALATTSDATAVTQVADQPQLFAAVRHLLEQLAEPGPLIVVVEDLHWADDATLDLLRYLMLSLPDAPVLVLATARSGPVADQMLSRLGRLPAVSSISLAALPPDEARRLAEVLIDQTSSAAPGESLLDVERLVERSGGNPLYLEELVAAADSDGLSASLRGLLLSRLESLPGDARRLVDLLSLGDPPVRFEDLIAATGWAEERLDTALGQARAGETLTLTPGGRVSMRHPLLGDAAREALEPGRRRALHRAWAVAASRSRAVRGPQAASAVAYHWDRAGEPGPALRAAWDGANAASGLQAHAIRAALLDRVSDLWAHADTRDMPADPVDVLTEAARAHELAGAYEQAAHRLDQAMDLLDPAQDLGRAACVLVARGRVEWAWHDTSPEPTFQRALDLLPEVGYDDVRARVLSQWVDQRANVGHMAGIRERAEQAARLARAVGDRAAEARALRCLAMARWLDEPAEAVGLLRRAITLAEQVGDYDVMLSAMGNLVFTRAEFLGEREQALVDVQEFLAIARKRGMDVHVGTGGLLIIAAQAQLDVGDLEAAQESAIRSMEVLGEHGYSNFARSVLADAALIRGDLDTARTVLADVARSPHGHLETGAHDAASWLAWLDDGPTTAADMLLPYLCQALDAGDDTVVIVNSNHVLPLARYVRLSQPIPDPESEATRTLVLLRDVYRRVVPHNAVVAVLDATLATLESTDPADHWRAAVGAYRRDPGLMTLYWHIDTLLRLAETTPERAEALDAVDTAGRLANQLGSPAQLDEITTLRRHLAGQPGPAGLTPREAEVLGLVARGLTNSQIADRLFISRSTAGVHISSILTKTGTPNRHEAAQWAHDHGLVRAGDIRQA
jgi:DNA-binding CsgD family transcriptional regulator/tetratricopeptide (TPR) repeat protein